MKDSELLCPSCKKMLRKHSHVGDVFHLRVALQGGETADPRLRVHAGNSGAAARTRRPACLRRHPRISRAHSHPACQNPPPQAPP